MVSTKLKYAIPRVSTRGTFDLWDGSYIGKRKHTYTFYPKYKFDKIFNEKEVVIFVHGMRNSRWGAVNGARLLKNKLRRLGCKMPVIAFSYDADVRGAHRSELYEKVLDVARYIAEYNGLFLSRFIIQLKNRNPNIKIHIVAHSLGCNVIENLGVNGIESIHLFGSPVEISDFNDVALHAKKTVNYVNPKDEVIKDGVKNLELELPSCLYKLNDKDIGVVSRYARAKDHRFRSYLKELKRFP